MTIEAAFPTGTKSLPVPAPLLGSLLAEIEDVAELKATLRFLWHAAQVKGAPKWVDETTLLSDTVLQDALGSQEAIRTALAAAETRGTLLRAGGRYLLHTPENERAAARVPAQRSTSPVPEATKREQANIYSLYEANIGLLTPMVADQLRDAEATYPPEWIVAAFKEAVERNVRNWRYISAILERWAAEGPYDDTQPRNANRGESGRHSQTASAAEYLRKRRAAG